jgi:hypothetical protein
MMKSWLIPAIAGIGRVPESLPTPPKGTLNEDIAEVAMLIFRYLRSTSNHESHHVRVLQLLFKMLAVFQFDIDTMALTTAAIGRPGLREAIPELQDFEIYGNYAEIVRRADFWELTPETVRTTWQDPSDNVMFAVSDILRPPYIRDKLSGHQGVIGRFSRSALLTRARFSSEQRSITGSRNGRMGEAFAGILDR